MTKDRERGRGRKRVQLLKTSVCIPLHRRCSLVSFRAIRPKTPTQREHRVCVRAIAFTSSLYLRLVERIPLSRLIRDRSLCARARASICMYICTQNFAFSAKNRKCDSLGFFRAFDFGHGSPLIPLKILVFAYTVHVKSV